MELPQLNLGLVGFDADAERMVRQNLIQHARLALAENGVVPGRQVLWSVADFREADALLVYGATAIGADGDAIRFRSAQFDMPAQTPLGVEIGEIAQPFAISHPTHLKALGVDVKFYPVFDLSVPASLPLTLRQFEKVLRPLRNLYALAVELALRRKELQPIYTYHLEYQGRVDALVDLPQRMVMVRPGARPANLAQANWQQRPRPANYAPSHFIRCTLPELTWLFAMHCREPNLPSRYLKKPIFLHALPRVRNSILYPRHSTLLDILASSPFAMDQLREALSTNDQTLVRDIYALYLVKSISTSGPVDDPLAVPSMPNEMELEDTWTLKQTGKELQTLQAGLPSLRLGDSSLTPE